MKREFDTMGDPGPEDQALQQLQPISKRSKYDVTEEGVASDLKMPSSDFETGKTTTLEDVQRSRPPTLENDAADKSPEDRSVIIAQKLLASFTEAVKDIGFAHIPLELRLAIALGQDATKRITNQSKVGFKDLPLELRRKIYGYILVKKHTIIMSDLPPIKGISTYDGHDPLLTQGLGSIPRMYHSGHIPYRTMAESWLPMQPKQETKKDMEEKNDRKATNILLVSKAISEEALDVLYMSNTFQVNFQAELSTSSGSALMAFSVANQLRVKHFRLTYDFKNHRWLRNPDRILSLPVQAEWKPIFQGLATLKIATSMDHDLKWLEYKLASRFRRAVRLGHLPGPLTFDTTRDAYLQRWSEWFKTGLEVVANLTSSDLTVQVDVGSRAESQAVVDQYLAGRHRVVNLYSGTNWPFTTSRGME